MALWENKKNHSVKQVQSGYTPYIIKDMGRYNPKFVEEEFNKFIAR